MKGIVLISCLLNSLIVTAQNKIEVSFDKSVILLFEMNIKPNGWNCGAKELVGVGVKDNKILLQAKEEHFDETNLIVELIDGSVYAFDLVYNNSPKMTLHIIKSDIASYVPEHKLQVENQQPISNNAPTQNSKSVRESEKGKSLNPEDLCNRISKEPDYLKRIGLISKKMFLYVGGIYVFDNKLYFKVHLKNVSSVPYDVDYYQFIIKNVKTGLSKSVSPRAEKVIPVHVMEPENKTVGKDEILTIIYVFEKFTISENKKLYIEFWEKNGDRNLEIPIESIDILNAKNSL